MPLERRTRDALLEAASGRESLRRPGSLPEPWSHGDLAHAVDGSIKVLGWSGLALPAVWLADAFVVPVVSIDREAWRVRCARRLGPIVDRAWWLAASDASYSLAPTRPLEIGGFLVMGSVRRLRGALGRLHTTAPVAALVPSANTLDTIELTRCDYFGFGVVAVTHGRPRLIVDPGPWTPPRGHVHFQRRLREEQLFDIALRTAQVPDCS